LYEAQSDMSARDFFLKICLSSLLAVTLSACSGGGGSGSSSGPLEGTWTRACHIDDFGDYVTETLTFSGSNLDYSYTEYEFLDCTNPLFRVRTTGTFSIGEDVDLSASVTATKINETFSKVYETPLSGVITTFNNTNNFCGFANWQTDVEKDVTNCADISGVVGTYYDVFVINGNNLIFGDVDYGDGLSDATRPTELESKPYSR